MTLLSIPVSLLFEGANFSFYEIAKALTIPGWGVIITLILMSVYLVAIGIERYMTYNKAKADSQAYAPKVAAALKGGKVDEAIALGGKHKESHLAAVVTSGLNEFKASGSVESADRALERSVAVKTADLKRGLSGLATVGSTAPFVGLFGTVVGIIGAFQALRANESAGIGAVGGAIAEALVATAFGILVAVPAVWLFNWFTSKVTAFAIEMENSASELIDYLSKQGK